VPYGRRGARSSFPLGTGFWKSAPTSSTAAGPSWPAASATALPRASSRISRRVFNHPHAVFTEEMLRPELQTALRLADGMTTCRHPAAGRAVLLQRWQRRPGLPPLRALLHIMRDASLKERLFRSGIRALFSHDQVLASRVVR